MCAAERWMEARGMKSEDFLFLAFYCPTFPHVTTSRQGRFEGNEGSVRSESHATPITACGEISELCVNKIDSRLTSIMSWREKNLGKLKWKQSSCAVSWFPRHLSPSDPSLSPSLSHYCAFVRPRKFRSGIGEGRKKVDAVFQFYT